MPDLPVIATASEAYRFLAREFATIFRLSWATLLIVALVQFLLARTVFGQMAAALAQGDVAGAAVTGRHPLWLSLKILAEMAGTAIVAVPIHQLILFGDRKDGHYFHLGFGKREALFVLLALAVGAITVLFATIVVSPFGEPTTGLAPFVAALVFVIGLYLSIRLWPVLPIIVVNGRLDLAGAWEMTRGRFWSLFALGLIGSIPIGVAALAIDSLMPSFDSLMDTITGPRERKPPAATAALAVRRAQTWLPLRVLFDFVMVIIYAAVAVALISYAYKLLTGRQPHDTLTPKPD
jgi:hypothetical protein